SRCAVLHRFSYSFSPFCFHHPATPEIYTLSLHDALPIWLVSMAALYGAYAWIALSAVAGNITVGGMTMYLLVFKQGQSALSAILDRKSTRLNSSHVKISYAVFCLKKKKKKNKRRDHRRSQ